MVQTFAPFRRLGFIAKFLTVRRIFLYGFALSSIGWLLIALLQIELHQSGQIPGGDFIGIYSGFKAAKYYPAKLYDLNTLHVSQDQIAISPLREGHWEYGYPPFFTAIFLPLANLSYVQAYWSWMILTFLLYFFSLAIFLFLSRPQKIKTAATLTTAAASPAFLWIALSGQTTAIGFFVSMLALVFIRLRMLFCAGFALGFLSYRPQFLIVVLPLLILKRCWPMISGFVASTLVLIVIGGWFFSFSAYWAYFGMLQIFAESLTQGTYPVFKFISFYGWFRSFVPHPAATGLTALLSLLLAFWLYRCWKGTVRPEGAVFNLQCALIVSVTLLVMQYGLIYDLLLLTISALLVYERPTFFPPYGKILFALLYFAPLYSEITAIRIGVSVTPLLIFWLCYEIYQCCLRMKPSELDLSTQKPMSAAP